MSIQPFLELDAYEAIVLFSVLILGAAGLILIVHTFLMIYGDSGRLYNKDRVTKAIRAALMSASYATILFNFATKAMENTEVSQLRAKIDDTHAILQNEINSYALVLFHTLNVDPSLAQIVLSELHNGILPMMRDSMIKAMEEARRSKDYEILASMGDDVVHH